MLTAVPGERPPLVVTRNRLIDAANQPRTFDSVRKALAQAQPGDRILLLDRVYEDSLELQGSQVARNVTIESGAPSGEETVWLMPGTLTGNVPLLTLSNVQGLCIKGIIFDAQGQSDELIRISGRCAGLKLENVQLRGFKRSGLRLTDCTAAREDPVLFSRLRIVSTAREGTEAAVLLVAQPGPEPLGNQHLVFQDCRFEGPYQSAVLAAGPVTTEFKRNRFLQSKIGFSFAKTEPQSRLRLTLLSNTFCRLDTCVFLERMPLPGDSRVEMRNNLFARVTAVVRGNDAAGMEEAVKQLFASSGKNVRDRASDQEGLRVVAATAMDFELPIDPSLDHQFLRYPKTSDLALAGADGQPVGVPPHSP